LQTWRGKGVLYPAECSHFVTHFGVLLLFIGYPMGDGCEDLKCDFYATCQLFDDDDDVSSEVTDDVINAIDTVGSERGRALCVCPAFCPQVCDRLRSVVVSF